MAIEEPSSSLQQLAMAPKRPTGGTSMSSEERISLRDHFDQRFDDWEKKLAMLLVERGARSDQRFLNLEQAVATSLLLFKESLSDIKMANEKRFDIQNEFRGQLKDQQSTFLNRTEYDVGFKNMISKLDELKDQVSKLMIEIVPRAEHASREKSLEVRFDDIKTILANHQVNFIPRNEYDSAHKSLVLKVEEVKTLLAAQQIIIVSRSEIETYRRSIEERVVGLESARLEEKGSQKGISNFVAIMVSGVSILIALATLYFKSKGAL